MGDRTLIVSGLTNSDEFLGNCSGRQTLATPTPIGMKVLARDLLAL
jgi:hypothetical protein